MSKDSSFQRDNYKDMSFRCTGNSIQISTPKDMSFHHWGNSLLLDMKRNWYHHSNKSLHNNCRKAWKSG
jgi:hypothetical protein